MSFNINPKTISRIAAVQSIYCNYATDLSINKVMEDIKALYIDKYNEEGEEYELKIHQEYFKNLVLNTLNNILDIDKLIEANLAPGWNIDKLHLTLLSILRVGTAELLYCKQAPFKAVINEFTNIANNMLSDKEVPFVNSILQKIHDQNIKDDPFV